MTYPTDTIAAQATPQGRGGVSIIRVSGPLVKMIAEKILGKLPNPRYAYFGIFFDENNAPLDEGLALFFSAPHSFTGEDVLELHGHGGPIVVDRIIRRILALGARLARPGEFSERAFLNEKMDLTQAEAIADLIDAASEEAARSAMRSLQGEFSQKINQLVEALIQLRIYVEAAIDFVEEEIDFLADANVIRKLKNIILELETIQANATQGSLLRDGITAVIAGQPNVGKSSLLNALSGKEIAIVTDIPGTTRDVLRDYIVLDGMPIHIIDTAGLRESNDQVEQEGIRRAKKEIVEADIILFVIDATRPETMTQVDFPLPDKTHIIIVRNKIDLENEAPSLRTENNKTIISLSAKKQLGLDLLKNHIKHCVGFQNQTEGNFSARRRHLDALARAKACLTNGLHAADQKKAYELLAEDLRQAQKMLGEITGEFSSDDLLGRIFSSFCIGK